MTEGGRGLEELRVQFEQLREWVRKSDKSAQDDCVFRPFLQGISSSETTGLLTLSCLRAIFVLLKQAGAGISADTLTDIIELAKEANFPICDTTNQHQVLLLIVQLISFAVLHTEANHLLSDHVVWDVVEALHKLALLPVEFPVLSQIAQVNLDEIVRLVCCRVKRFTNTSNNGEQKGFGLPCAVKIFGYLCNKVKEEQNDEGVVVSCLNLLCEALVACGNEISEYPSLMSFVSDDICAALLRLCRVGAINSSNEIVLCCLQIIRVLWCKDRWQLKMQWEAIMNCIFIHALHFVGCLINPTSPFFLETTAASTTEDLSIVMSVDEMETNRLIASQILTCLVDLLSDPKLITDCFVNYDCESHSSDLTKNLIEMLSCVVVSFYNHQSKHSTNSSTTATTNSSKPGSSASSVNLSWCEQIAQMCVDGLQLVLTYFPTTENLYSIDTQNMSALEEKLSRKQHLAEGCRRFNKNPKKGLIYLQEHDILPSNPLTPESVAQFLRSLPPSLEKDSVGAYLGAVGKIEAKFIGDTVDFHEKVLSLFVDSFEFTNMSFVNSLRVFLTSFRLPGEAQQIDRILAVYALRVYEESIDCRHMYCSDVAYLLSFSLIMLNTDLHNPNIKPEKKMTLPQFLCNNRHYGKEVSSTHKLSDSFLTSLYEELKVNPIRTLANHKEKNSIINPITSERWSDLLAERENQLVLTPSEYSPLLWKTIGPCLTNAFVAARDSKEKCLYKCGELSLGYNVEKKCSSRVLNCFLAKPTCYWPLVYNCIPDSLSDESWQQMWEAFASPTSKPANWLLADCEWSLFQKQAEKNHAPFTKPQLKLTTSSSMNHSSASSSSGFFSWFFPPPTSNPLSSIHSNSHPSMVRMPSTKSASFNMKEMLTEYEETVKFSNSSFWDEQVLSDVLGDGEAELFEKFPVKHHSTVSACLISMLQSRVEKVFLPPPSQFRSNTKLLSPTQCLVAEESLWSMMSKESIEKPIEHLLLLLKLTHPLIVGNLTVNGMATKQTCFVLNQAIHGFFSVVLLPPTSTTTDRNKLILTKLVSAVSDLIGDKQQQQTVVETILPQFLTGLWLCSPLILNDIDIQKICILLRESSESSIAFRYGARLLVKLLDREDKVVILQTMQHFLLLNTNLSRLTILPQHKLIDCLHYQTLDTPSLTGKVLNFGFYCVSTLACSTPFHDFALAKLVKSKSELIFFQENFDDDVVFLLGFGIYLQTTLSMLSETEAPVTLLQSHLEQLLQESPATLQAEWHQVEELLRFTAEGRKIGSSKVKSVNFHQIELLNDFVLQAYSSALRQIYFQRFWTHVLSIYTQFFGFGDEKEKPSILSSFQILLKQLLIWQKQQQAQAEEMMVDFEKLWDFTTKQCQLHLPAGTLADLISHIHLED